MKAKELAPRDPSTNNNLGCALMEVGRKEEAREAFARAIELDPNQFMAWANLGDLLSETGDLDKAINCFRKVINLNPQGDEATKFIEHSHYMLGYTLGMKGERNKELDEEEIHEAVRSLRKAINLNPVSARAHFALHYFLDLMVNELSRKDLQEEAQHHLSEARRLGYEPKEHAK